MLNFHYQTFLSWAHMNFLELWNIVSVPGRLVVDKKLIFNVTFYMTS